MGQLTNDLTRLRREVEALRDARGALMNNLTRGAGDLTRAVAALRRETADDLRGARLAWRGEGPGKSRPVPKKEPWPSGGSPEKTGSAGVQGGKAPGPLHENPENR